MIDVWVGIRYLTRQVIDRELGSNNVRGEQQTGAQSRDF